MKLERIQSVSVVLMVTGLLLAAIGASGMHYFKGPRGSAATAASAEAIDTRIAQVQARIAAMQARAVSDQSLPENDRELLPVGEGPVEPAEENPAPVVQAAALPPPKPKAEVAMLDRKAPPAPAIIKPATPAPALATPAPKRNEMGGRPKQAGLQLSAGQVESMVQRLRTVSRGTVTLRVPMNDRGAEQAAEGLRKIFYAADWKARPVQKVSSEARGLTLLSGTFPPPPHVRAIFSALTSAGFNPSTGLDPSLPKESVVLVIGSPQ